MTVTELIAGRDDAVALIEPEGGRRVTAGELRDEVAALAGRLAAAGIERGDRVSLVLADGPRFVRWVLATTALGAAAAPLNPAYTVDEFRFYLEDLEPRVVLTATGEASAARKAAPDGVRFLDVDGDELAARETPVRLGAESDDVALV